MWWYADVVSDDRAYAMTIIVFVGAVFSPAYFRDRNRGRGEALRHCGVNAVVYRTGLAPANTRGRWAYTEYDGAHVDREPASLRLGSNRVWWEGDTLCFELHERAPLSNLVSLSGQRLEGTVRIHAPTRIGTPVELDAQGRHRWYPVAPHARAEVELQHPSLSFQGSAYTDSNWGDEPLEAAFRRWDWSRADIDDGSIVLYDVDTIGGGPQTRGWRMGHDGSMEQIELNERVPLGRALWGVESFTRTDSGQSSSVVRRLEDTPFYRRNLIESRLGGQTVLGMHEHLDLTRFTKPWVQFLLPFRIRRVR